MTCRPGHPPRHESFGPGNTAAVKHGSFSARRLAEVADQLRPALAGSLGECHWLEEVDAAEVEDWLVREALVRTLLGELQRRREENAGRIGDDDRWILERIGSAQNRAQASRDRLLLNPLHRFRAGRDAAASAVDLESVAERGRRARLAAEARVEVGSAPAGAMEPAGTGDDERETAGEPQRADDGPDAA
jgi:hypothetical protein